MTRVSVIITCYNLGAYLDEAAASVLGQTHRELEIVLVDDGSTDLLTRAVVARLGRHPRIRLLQLENGGVARARNLGIAAASGEYVMPFDADDRLLPDYVAQAAQVLDSQSDVGFVGCHFRTFGAYEQLIAPVEYAFPALLVENKVPSCPLIRRRCWQEVGGYCADLNGFADWDMVIGIIERGYRGHVIPKALYEYRIRPDSMLARDSQPKVYAQRLQTLYRRHQQTYERYFFDVLYGKDTLYSIVQAWRQQQVDFLTHERDWQKSQASYWQHEVARLMALLRARDPWLARLDQTWSRQRQRLHHARMLTRLAPSAVRRRAQTVRAHLSPHVRRARAYLNRTMQRLRAG